MVNRKNKPLILPLAVAMIFTAYAFAHEGGKHFRGTVKSVAADSLTIVTTTKETVTLKLLPTTKFVKNGQPASLQDLNTGEKVVIHAKQNGTSWEGEEVQFGTMPAHAAHTH